MSISLLWSSQRIVTEGCLHSPHKATGGASSTWPFISACQGVNLWRQSLPPHPSHAPRVSWKLRRDRFIRSRFAIQALTLSDYDVFEHWTHPFRVVVLRRFPPPPPHRGFEQFDHIHLRRSPPSSRSHVILVHFNDSVMIQDSAAGS